MVERREDASWDVDLIIFPGVVVVRLTWIGGLGPRRKYGKCDDQKQKVKDPVPESQARPKPTLVSMK
jgi:hypothetical protein